MKSVWVLWRTLTLLIMGMIVFASGATAAPQIRFAQGELLVKFKPGVGNVAKNEVHGKFGSRLTKEFSSGAQHVKLKKELSVEQAIQEYLTSPFVEYAEPNYLVHVSERTPNDPLFNYMWDMKNTGQSGGTPGVDMKTTQAWDYTTGNGNLVVAVIDSGIDYTHEDLAANIWTNPGEIPGNGVDDDGNGYVDDVHGWNAVTCTRYNLFGDCTAPVLANGNPMDSMGHGTHCAGTIGADGNNGVGIAGVNWDVKVAACRFINDQGWGTFADAIACFDYVQTLKERGVEIVATSNSWGGGGYSQALYDALQAQMNSNILTIAAASNEGEDNDTYAVYPANYELPNIISVAAIDRNNQKASWSDYGKHSVDVGAPGVDIVSLRAGATDLYGDGSHFIPNGDPNAKYYRMSGTSMATPHVAGLAALVKSQNLQRGWVAIRNLIVAGGSDALSMKYSTISGKIVNAYGSLTCSNSPVFAAIQYPAEPQVGVAATLSALSINCDQPVGPVTVTVPGGTVVLADDGIGPDVVAGDGIFSATWTPAASAGSLLFSSPLGTDDPLFLISTRHLGSGSTYYDYHQTLAVQGGTPPFAWSVYTGTMPPGLTLNPATGEISGRATATGMYSFVAIATDANLSKVGRALTITVRNDRLLKRWEQVNPNYGSTCGLAIDGAGNICVSSIAAGSYYPNQTDYLIQQFDPSPQMRWERTYDGSSSEGATGIAVDINGNLLVTGYSDIHGSFMGTNNDYLTVKYDTAGNLVWAKSYDSGATDAAQGVTTDAAGNVVVTGVTGQGGYSRCTTLKYDASGNVLWTASYGNGVDTIVAGGGVALDPAGNVYVAGSHTPMNGSMSYLVLKYNSSGNLLWSRTYDFENGTAVAVAADAAGNVYVTGGHFLTFKYDTNGNLLWTRLYESGCQDDAIGIKMDASGNLYVGGESLCATDTTYPTVLKYDPSGNLLMTKVEETGRFDMLHAIALDGGGNVYLAGILDVDSVIPVSWALYINKYSLVYGIVTSSLPSATPGKAYNQKLLADGGLTPYAYAVTSGSLPNGLTLSGSGVISGTPTTTGTFAFTVRGTAANAESDLKTLSIAVRNPLAIAPPALPDGTSGVAYQQTLTASGGLTPYTWFITAGNLPAGLTLSSTGVISGTPSAAGTFGFTVQMKDANLESASRAFSIRVSALTTYYLYTKSHCAQTTYTTGPQYVAVGKTSGDCSAEDAVSISFKGAKDLLEGYAANGGYAANTVVTGQATGNSLSFLAKNSGGTGSVKLVEVNPSTGAVVQTLSTVAVPLTANTKAYVTNLSSLTGTVRKGNTFGIMLAISTTARSTNEIRWGKTNGGPGLEQWFTVAEAPAVGANLPPVAKANGPYAGRMNEPVSFSSAGSSDPDGGTLAYSWDFGDMSTSTDANPVHAYAAVGTYIVKLTVTDAAGASNATTTTASITPSFGTNQTPVANAGPDVTAKVRVGILFNGTGSYDVDGTITSYQWSFGDGANGTGVSLTHSYGKPGTYLVALTVTDNQGATMEDVATVTITR